MHSGTTDILWYTVSHCEVFSLLFLAIYDIVVAFLAELEPFS